MYASLVSQAAEISDDEWRALEDAAQQVTPLSILPVVGAGASRACGAPSASILAQMLYGKMSDGTLPLSDPPSDLDTVAVREVLGKLADAAYLENKRSRAVLEAIGFGDTSVWPTADDIFDAFEITEHDCSYRVLARLAKESFISESVTFNYDCNFEGGLLKEGFFASTTRTPGRWPERFSVIANAQQNADVARRAEFTLNKVHGCVQTWRDAGGSEEASDAVVIRWSQLLDWREDRWARDLFRDRARRHVLLLLGFSGTDAVIHSTLQAVMKELARDEELEGPSRVRVFDTEPTTLTLRMLVDAGHGTVHDRCFFAVSNLAAAVLTLYVLLVHNRLAEYAHSNARALSVPPGRRSLLRRISLSGPAMLRWTWSILGSTQASTGLRGLRQRGDNYYIPLSASPARTLTAFEIRDELAASHGVEAEDEASDQAGSFLAVPRVGRAFMPIGLYPHETEQLASAGSLTQLPVPLTSPAGGLDRVVVARDRVQELRAFSLETGREVGIERA
jgi:SIR2-like domain